VVVKVEEAQEVEGGAERDKVVDAGMEGGVLGRRALDIKNQNTCIRFEKPVTGTVIHLEKRTRPWRNIGSMMRMKLNFIVILTGWAKEEKNEKRRLSDVCFREGRS
jgi:hypothetical protein